MRVYIASKYIDHRELNGIIYLELKKAGIDVFLPETINIDALDLEDMHTVAEKCYYEMDQCDTFLFVYPFGKSVACEFGYAIALKRFCQKSIEIISLQYNHDGEAMYTPYIDKKIEIVYDLVNYLKCKRNRK